MRRSTNIRRCAILAAAILAASAIVARGAEVAAPEPIPLAETPHIHGVVVDPDNASRLVLVTPAGIYAATRDGRSIRVSEGTEDFRGFAPHPTEPHVFLSSGRATDGTNLGFVESRDFGHTWRQISPGLDGPVIFLATAISPADPNVIYGFYDAIHVSRDGGRTWRRSGPEPEETIGLAASAVDPDRLYAAAIGGLAVSSDGGVTWKPAAYEGQPASMVHTTADGTLYAYILGVGLVSTKEPTLSWTLLKDDGDAHRIRHLAIDPSDPARLYAVDFDGHVIESADGGRSWKIFPAEADNAPR